MDESGSQYDEEDYPEGGSNKSYSQHSYQDDEENPSHHNDSHSKASQSSSGTPTSMQKWRKTPFRSDAGSGLTLSSRVSVPVLAVVTPLLSPELLS